MLSSGDAEGAVAMAAERACHAGAVAARRAMPERWQWRRRSQGGGGVEGEGEGVRMATQEATEGPKAKAERRRGEGVPC